MNVKTALLQILKCIIERNLKQRSEKYKQDFGLEFASWNDTVTAYVNVQKAIRWILSKESPRNIIKCPLAL